MPGLNLLILQSTKSRLAIKFISGYFFEYLEMAFCNFLGKNFNSSDNISIILFSEPATGTSLLNLTDEFILIILLHSLEVKKESIIRT